MLEKGNTLVSSVTHIDTGLMRNSAVPPCDVQCTDLSAIIKLLRNTTLLVRFLLRSRKRCSLIVPLKLKEIGNASNMRISLSGTGVLHGCDRLITQ